MPPAENLSKPSVVRRIPTVKGQTSVWRDCCPCGREKMRGSAPAVAAQRPHTRSAPARTRSTPRSRAPGGAVRAWWRRRPPGLGRAPGVWPCARPCALVRPFRRRLHGCCVGRPTALDSVGWGTLPPHSPQAVDRSGRWTRSPGPCVDTGAGRTPGRSWALAAPCGGLRRPAADSREVFGKNPGMKWGEKGLLMYRVGCRRVATRPENGRMSSVGRGWIARFADIPPTVRCLPVTGLWPFAAWPDFGR